MTAKEKAEDLHTKIKNILQDYDSDIGEEIICSLLAQDLSKIICAELLDKKLVTIRTTEITEFFKQVDKELEKIQYE